MHGQPGLAVVIGERHRRPYLVSGLIVDDAVEDDPLRLDDFKMLASAANVVVSRSAVIAVIVFNL
jgi:hypothetical protein